MNREIKFRVFFEDQWRYFLMGQSMTDYQRAIYDQCCLLGLKFFEYTGYKDDLGVEIYEGDVCDLAFDEFGSPIPENFKGTVKFYEGAFWVDNGQSAYPVFQELAIWVIIGNIYLNPELC